jgi:hypothetical protein
MQEAVSDGVKLAVIECVPTESADVDRVATPESLVAALPSDVLPVSNVTVPASQPAGLTVAVRTTDWPKVDGSADDFSDVLVLALFTTCDSAVDVEAVQSERNPGAKAAVIECVPTDSADVYSVATPPWVSAVPSETLPSLKVTVPPVHTSAADVIVAVKVTFCPTVDGFADDFSEVAVLAGFTTCDTIGDVAPGHVVPVG